jgi:glutaconate CoA-transferase subunit B
MMKPDPDSKEFEVVTLHPGVTRDQVRERTAWCVRFAAGVEDTPVPSALELETLRDLQARTARAHERTP